VEYICLVNYYCNCRKHDGSTSTDIKFFADVNSFMDFLLKEINSYEVLKVYNSEGELLDIQVVYEMGSHNVSGIIVEDEEGVKVRTEDDGHGALRWGESSEIW
jgi:hypothetical protein